MRYKTTTSTNLLFDYYNMIDSFKHRLTVHGNIENTLWSSEPFSWWQNMGILALGDFSQKGFYARCCDAGIGWQSNLGLFFLIWLALELARGEGGGVVHDTTAVRKKCFRMLLKQQMWINRLEAAYIGTLVIK